MRANSGGVSAVSYGTRVSCSTPLTLATVAVSSALGHTEGALVRADQVHF